MENKKIFIAGHTGLLGSSLSRHYIKKKGYAVLTATRRELELKDNRAVHEFLLKEKPEIVIIAAGKVGGIYANSHYPAEFIYDNIMIEANLIHASWEAKVKKLLNFGSSCMYPKVCDQPMTVEMLLTGSMEKTSEPYAIAKLSGLIMSDAFNRQYKTNFINAIPANVYGPEEPFDEQNSHVIPALIKKFHKAKQTNASQVVIWGSGKVTREFLYVDDASEACALILEKYQNEKPLNITNGTSVSIKELAQTIKEVVGYSGKLVWDTSKPDGSLQKSLECRTINDLGWKARTSLCEGIQKTYDWYLNNN